MIKVIKLVNKIAVREARIAAGASNDDYKSGRKALVEKLRTVKSAEEIVQHLSENLFFVSEDGFFGYSVEEIVSHCPSLILISRKGGWHLAFEDGSTAVIHLDRVEIETAPVVEISSSHEIATESMFGHGRICEKGSASGAVIPCTLGCQRRVDGSGRFMGSVFAVVDHPVHGVIGVSPEEFEALGLPELAGYDPESAK